METTNNPFAIALVFYYKNRRSKLAISDLTKISRKYKQKPDQLLSELSNKYEVEIPKVVLLVDVLRIVSQYTIPESYEKLLNLGDSNTGYDSKLDAVNSSFDAEFALIQAKRIIAANTEVMQFDNMSKTKHLIPGISGNMPSHGILREIIDRPKERERRLHIVHQIANLSVEKASGSSGEKVESPLVFIYNLMKEKQRARVLIRRKNRVRGWVEGYVKAFDKHFNLLLSDVDEEYIVQSIPLAPPSSNAPSNSSECIPSSASRTVRRHLVQILLRGDIIILICKTKLRCNSASITK